MVRGGSQALVALVVAACTGAGTPSPGTSAVEVPTGTPSAAPSAATSPSPIVPSGPRPTSTPVPTSAITEPTCPTTSPIDLDDLNLEECVGSHDVEVRGWVDAPVGVGFEPTWIEPSWLYFPVFEWALWSRPPGPDQDCGGIEPCNSMFVFVNPDSDVVFEGPPRWVIVTAHTHDPASTTCHWVSEPPRTFTAEEDAEAREHCASSFVITAVRDAP